jgi:hypothetical protein
LPVNSRRILGYLPAHYVARLTPLRFINVPKIRTITQFGDRVILTNSAYIDVIAETRMWVDEKIIQLLATRLLCYRDLAKQLSKEAGHATVPAWYSESISDYWDIAGLPHTLFFCPLSEKSRKA